jgi:ferricrocin synthase
MCSAPAQLRLMVEQVHAIAMALIKFPDEPIQSLPSLAPISEDLLSVARANPTPALINARDRHPIYWLEHYAQEHPDHAAVIVASEIEEWGAKTKQWSYRELHEVIGLFFLRVAGSSFHRSRTGSQI